MTGSSVVQGELWGARPRDWAELMEMEMRPLYEAVFTKANIRLGTEVLDVGCGSGLFLQLADARGARLTGIDASSALLAIARRRVPRGDLRQGEIEDLPFEDATFDVVTGFNSFQYAADPVNALREARRVKKLDAPLFIATWGRAEECEAAGYIAAVGANLPAPPPGAPGPFALSEPGALERLAQSAGLTPGKHIAVNCLWQFSNLDTALRGLLSAGPAVKAMRHTSEAQVRRAVAEAIAPFRTSRGAYQLENTFRYLITY